MDKNNKFKMAAAAILNSIYRSQLVYIAHIWTKFGKYITFEILHTCIPKYWTRIKSKMAIATILDFCTNSKNSAANWHRLMKFCSNVVGCYQK